MVTKVKGLNIKILRLKAGFLQYQLAALLGIPPNRLSEIESDRRVPSPELLQKILEIIGNGDANKAK